MFGYEKDELTGSSADLLHVSKGMSEVFNRATLAAIDAEGVFNAEYQMRHKDGSVFSVKMVVSELDDLSGQRIGLMNIVRDVTDRRQSEEEPSSLRDQVKKRFRKQSITKAVEKLSYSVARNRSANRHPSEGVNRDSEVERKVMDVKRKECLDQIRDTCNHLRRLVDDLLKSSSTAQGEIDHKGESPNLDPRNQS